MDSTVDYTTFANNLRLLMESRGLSIQSFSSDIKVSSAAISRYLACVREPSTSYVVKIAQYFDVSLDWLLGISGDRFDVFPQDIQDVVQLYSLASEDDRRVIRTVLSKYKKMGPGD